MRHVMLLLLAAAGCAPAADGPAPVDNTWTIDAERASLAPSVCSNVPEARVAATLAGSVGWSTRASGLQPSWNQPLLSSDERDLVRSAVRVEVFVRCAGVERSAGAALVYPSERMLADGGVTVGPFGSVRQLVLGFTTDGADPVGDAPPAGDASSWSSTVTSDPGTDDGVDPGTDPSIDPGTDPGVDPSTDPGVDPSTDPGVDPSTDPGVDPSTDPSSDPSDCTDCARRVKRHPPRVLPSAR
jgi:hypothetical protein